MEPDTPGAARLDFDRKVELKITLKSYRRTSASMMFLQRRRRFGRMGLLMIDEHAL
jgi:hypothetical protein